MHLAKVISPAKTRFTNTKKVGPTKTKLVGVEPYPSEK